MTNLSSTLTYVMGVIDIVYINKTNLITDKCLCYLGEHYVLQMLINHPLNE